MELREAGAWLHRHWLRVVVTLGIGIVCAGFAARNLLFGTSVPVYIVVRSELVQSVVASGRVMTPQRVSIAAEAAGRVVRVPVAEGQRVSHGQVLIELDQTDERAAVAQAQAGIAQAEAKVRQLTVARASRGRAKRQQAEANVTQAQQQYQRTKDLVAKNFVAQSQLDDAQRNLDVALSQLRGRAAPGGNEPPGGSDYAVAKAALAQAKATLLAAQAKLDATVIRAPVDGILIARSVEPGDVAEAGKELMALAPAAKRSSCCRSTKSTWREIAIGQKALGSADAFPTQRFRCRSSCTSTRASTRPAAPVEVKLRVIDPPPYLRQDMTVSVDIEVAHRADALVVPSDALHDAGSAEPWVLVVRDRHTVRQPVKLGLRGDDRTEVVEGIVAGGRAGPGHQRHDRGRSARSRRRDRAECEPMNRFVPFECIAAIRFMREGLIQTTLIIVGVALGVSVIVFMSALLSALQTNLFRRTLNYQAQIVILPPEEVARPLRPSRETG